MSILIGQERFPDVFAIQLFVRRYLCPGETREGRIEIQREYGMIKDLSDDELTERSEIIAALRETGGNRTRAAKRLGYSRVTLWKKINRLGIEVPSG